MRAEANLVEIGLAGVECDPGDFIIRFGALVIIITLISRVNMGSRRRRSIGSTPFTNERSHIPNSSFSSIGCLDPLVIVRHA